MKIAQYKWTIVDDCIIAVTTDGKMPDAEWKLFVHEMDTKNIKRYLAYVIGSLDVDSVQRKLGIDVVAKRRIKVSVVNDSAVVRGIITAASWFGVDITSFPPDKVREAVKALGIPENRETAVMVALQTLKRSVTS